MKGRIKNLVLLGLLSLSSTAFAASCPDILQGKQKVTQLH